MNSLNPLIRQMWGTTLTRVDFDLQQISITLVIWRKESRQTPETIHRLEFRNVSDWRFFNSIPTPWNYAELTEFHEDTSYEQGYRVVIVLWDEAAQMTITAESVLLDGQPLLPEVARS